MQDLSPINPGGPGRNIFCGVSSGGGAGGGGGAVVVDRRLRPQPHEQQQINLKCPRCQSVNTKFCYYNNYNLSQPRHFCKSCRRYWTKGGVLRNVPVGGGCRKKSKRSKSEPNNLHDNHRAPPPASRSSSSENSALTAAAGISDVAFVSASASAMLETTGGEGPLPAATEDIFPEIGISVAGTNPTGILGLDYAANIPLRFHWPPPPQQQQQTPAEAPTATGSLVEEIKMQEFLSECFVDRTVPMDLPPPPPSSLPGRFGLTGLDWHGSMDPTAGLYDLTGAVDQGVFWNHGHWGESDPSLYLP